jgi:hypothetical protein
VNDLKPCSCGAKVRWCGDNNPDPEDDHMCHHIHCDNCGIHFSFEADDDAESIEELREATAKLWNTRPNKELIAEIEKLKRYRIHLSENQIIAVSIDDVIKLLRG